jgi:predicted Zn-dependent protease
MIRRTLISYVRQQEENADRAGVRFLTATGQSAKGMYETFRRFTNESLFAARDADPYLQSHPMPAERVAALEGLARSSPYWDKKDDPALQLRQWCAPRSRHHGRRTPCIGVIRRRTTVACALCARSRLTCMATCAPRSPRLMAIKRSPTIRIP